MLQDIPFEVRSGEVHVLAGENGAGKGTLIKILAGVHTEFEGRIEMDGREVRPKTPWDAKLLGPNARGMVMGEPNSALNAPEVDLRSLRGRNDHQAGQSNWSKETGTMVQLKMILKMRDCFTKTAGIRLVAVLFLAAICLLEAGCVTMKSNGFSRFIGVDNVSQFTRSESGNGETLLLSPVIQAGMDWNELIVSWNVAAPGGTLLKVEASAVSPDHATPFYSWGVWAPDRRSFARSSAGPQRGPDGEMDTDTLVLSDPATAVRLRITLVGTNGEWPVLNFIGLSFCNTKSVPAALSPNRGAWGKIIPTPERSQHGYPSQEGWCSPAALCMELAYWSEVLHRPEMNFDVPGKKKSYELHSQFIGSGGSLRDEPLLISS